MTSAGDGGRGTGGRTTTAIHTVGAALTAAAARLEAAGFPRAEARREADELYAALVCGATSRAWLDRERAIAPAVASRLEAAAARRASGVPQAYAAGRVNFRGHWLAVDPRVLIPRPETEGLVQLVIDWVDGRSGGRAAGPGGFADRPTAGLPVVADIGTGSGAIAIALALEARIAGVIATDVAPGALAVALDNAAACGAKDRIAFRRGPLCEALLDDVPDVIVSNPPYVATREWEALEPGVKDHEPRLALDGGADGLAVIRALVAEAPAHLAPGGLLALETDAGRAAETARLAQDAGFERVEVRDDLFGRPRYVLAHAPSGLRGT